MEINDITEKNSPKCIKLLEKKSKKEHWLFIFPEIIEKDPRQLKELIIGNYLFNNLDETTRKIKEASKIKYGRKVKFLQMHANIFIVNKIENVNNLKSFILNYDNKNSESQTFVELNDYLIHRSNDVINFILKIGNKISKSRLKNFNDLYIIYGHLQALLNSEEIIINSPKTRKMIENLSFILKTILYSHNLKRENLKYLWGLIPTLLISLGAFITTIIDLARK